MLDFDLLKKAAYVLGSETHFARTLALNIDACHHGVIQEYQMRSVEAAAAAIQDKVDHLETETEGIKALTKAAAKPAKKRRTHTPQSQGSTVVPFPRRDEI